MKIGDKVRFLNDVGGGTVAGFKGNLVFVEDEDGFQIPTAMSNVVLVEDEKRDGSVPYASRQAKNESGKKQPVEEKGAEVRSKEDFDNGDEPLPIEEREGGNQLNCYLAFVPLDVKSFTTTAFESYFVNDSNYFIQFNYLVADGASWTLHASFEAEPNTKTFIEEFERDALNSYDRVAIQMLAYKKGKPFVLKPVCDVQLRIDQVKFYKLHAFADNDFFEQPALLYPIVERDKPVRPLSIDAASLKKEWYSVSGKSDNSIQPRKNSDGYVRRYDNKRGGNPFINKRRDDDAVVVDLHADSLLDTTAGMTAADILNYQTETIRKTMEAHKTEKGKRIIFIHGKGEGVLRQALIHELQYRYKTCRYQDASFHEYGYGATQVTIR